MFIILCLLVSALLFTFLLITDLVLPLWKFLLGRLILRYLISQYENEIIIFNYTQKQKITMDCLKHTLNLRTIIEGNLLKIELYHNMLLYKGTLSSTNVDIAIVQASLKEGKYHIVKSEGSLLYLKVKELIPVVLHHCCSKSWFVAGKMDDYQEIMKKYPSTQYQYGVNYNGVIQQVSLNTWNKGMRISTIHSFPQGDDAKELKEGRTVWTKDTNDAESNKGGWYHQYTTADFKPWSSNGNMNIDLFVKSF